MKKRALFLVFLIFFSHAFSQQIDEQFLIAERITSVEREKILSSVTIHSNVRNALVYINGQYQGQTPCTINDLAPGTYRLRVSKQGYNSVSHYISVSRKRSSSFYVELERLVGYIQLFVITEN
ncbi:MAG: PEGA domain-containing protein, partial [Treponema sp.]|nr:PEGA domain-containing protein [Treponema sp.]